MFVAFAAIMPAVLMVVAVMIAIVISLALPGDYAGGR
jgi:hypothetical protein